MWRAQSSNLRYLDLKENIHRIQKDKILRNTPFDACLQILAGIPRGADSQVAAAPSNPYSAPKNPYTTTATTAAAAAAAAAAVTPNNSSADTFGDNKGMSAAQSSFNDRFNSFFIDYSLIPLLVQQNYIESSKAGVFRDNKLSDDQKLDKLSEAADAVSDMELAGGKTTIYGYAVYSFPFICFLLST
jgi:hypothetical protein